MKRSAFFLLLFLFAGQAAAQVTGLQGWDVYLDPGHSQRENMGVEGWSEAEHNLRVALHLRQMLLDETDVDTVFASRVNDTQSVSLSQRTAHANEVAADFFYSIHSDAGAASANSTLMLYGGWRENGETVEKTPNGGRLMGELVNEELTAALRIPSRGNYADRTFYQGFPFEHDNKWPYLHVNRVSQMASLLIEAGFHTNPTQNMRQMNTEFQQMQARATFWSFLDFHEIPRPANRIVSGYVIDAESGRYLNGATITIGDETYTTDTFESLFSRFTSDPGRMANGFYYFENLPEGELEVTFAAPGYHSQTTTVTPQEAAFTFLDAALFSDAPPTVAQTFPEDGTEAHRYFDPISITFTRPMDRASTQAAFSIEPDVEGTVGWTGDNYTMTFTPLDTLQTTTDYTVRIAETAEGEAGDAFDGDGDGEPGGEFVLQFRTGSRDVAAPVVVATHPRINADGVNLRPVVSITYDEPLDEDTVTPERFKVEHVLHGSEVTGEIRYYTVGTSGVVSFFPAEDLAPLAQYRFVVGPGVSDRFGNETTGGGQIFFTTGDEELEVTVIDDFDGNFTSNWWQPTQSGSTTGVEAEETLRSVETEVINPLTGSEQSMAIQYAWDAEATSTLIRTHLGGGSPRNVTFDEGVRMQAYVFGDGSGTDFRFAARASSGGIGVSPWIRLDWLGWRLVSWDLSDDGVLPWVGDSSAGPFFTESIQLTRGAGGSAESGTIYIDDLRIAEVQTAISAPVDEVPVSYALHQNYPNPFNPTTTIPFEVAQAGPVTLRIYNVLGAEVAVLVDGASVAVGRHEARWDASDMPSGVYFARMDAGGRTHTIKLVLLK